MRKKIISGLLAFLLVCGSVSLPSENGLSLSSGTAITASAEDIEGVEISAENFPDEIFRKYVADNFDTDGDGYLSAEEVAAVKEINCSGLGIYDMTGVKCFKKLEELSCYGNNYTSLDLSGCTSLKILGYGSSELFTLDISGTSIWSLGGNENLTSLNAKDCTHLEYVSIGGSKLTSLDVTGCENMFYLSCYGTGSLDHPSNQLTELDVSTCTSLITLDCSGNRLTKLNLGGNTSIKTLDCAANSLTSLDVSGCTALETLLCSRNKLTTLYVSGCPVLNNLYCEDNSFSELDLSDCEMLNFLYCNGNDFTTLYIGSPRLAKAYLTPTEEPHEFEGAMVYRYYEQRETDNGTVTLEYALNVDPDVTVNLDAVERNKGVEINAANFPDEAFRKYVADNFDTDFDGYLLSDEIASVKEIDCSNLGIKDMTGFEIFTRLERLYCYGNEIASLDLSGCTSLRYLSCGGNNLTTLDLSSCTLLKSLSCESNSLTALDVSSCTSLDYLHCSGNQLTSLDVSGCTALWSLYCAGNQLTSLDVSGCTALEAIVCFDNQLKSLDVRNCPILTYLQCYDNQLESIDASGNTAIQSIAAWNNKLTSLNINGCTELQVVLCFTSELTELDLSNCPKLRYLYCQGNKLTELDISKCPSLVSVYSDPLETYNDEGILGYENDRDDFNWDENDYRLYIDNTVKVITGVPEIDNAATGSIEVKGKKDTAGIGITFEAADGKVHKTAVMADGTFKVPVLADGDYTITASKPNCASRDYIVTIKDGAPTEDINVELHLYGDLDGDGEVSIFDSLKVNKHVKRTGTLEGYDLSVANVNEQGGVDIFDCMLINAHVKKTNLLW